MLQATNICIKCAGRLHQLFDFNLIKNKFDELRINSKENDETIENSCHFCIGGTQVAEEFQENVKKAIANTKWTRVS